MKEVPLEPVPEAAPTQAGALQMEAPKKVQVEQYAPQKLARNFRTSLCLLALGILLVAIVVIILASAVDYDEEITPMCKLQGSEVAKEAGCDIATNLKDNSSA